MMSVPLAGIIGSPLSGLILRLFSGASGLAGWQWLFLLEASPAVLMRIVVFCFLKDSPKHVSWLSQDGQSVGTVVRVHLKSKKEFLHYLRAEDVKMGEGVDLRFQEQLSRLP